MVSGYHDKRRAPDYRESRRTAGRHVFDGADREEVNQRSVLSSSGGKWATYVVPGFDGSKVGSHTLFMDGERSLWIGTSMDGLYRVYDGIAEHYRTADGLSGRVINLIYEDHEGNIWVMTDELGPRS